MNNRVLRIIFFFLFFLPISAAAQLRINEVMQSNIDCIMDDLNEFPDSWVELYNEGDVTENLRDYSIGTEDNKELAWKLSDKEVIPHSFVVIYCDKQAQGVHTDFRLDSGKGGSIYLFKTGCVDSIVNMAKQPAPNISYGRLHEGAVTFGYQLKPTPGISNCGIIVSKEYTLGNPIFEIGGGVYSAGFYLKITPPEDTPEGTTIHYTLDGSEPNDNSPLYSGVIWVDTTTCIRASLFCDGYLTPRSNTETYIFPKRNIELPIISIVTDNKYLYDSNIGILYESGYSDENYNYNWRRPVSIEIFDEHGDKVVDQLCEMRVAGGWSRRFALKSLCIYANKRFGEKRLNYEFFPKQKPGITDFKSIFLRNSGNDFSRLYMRDAIAQLSMGMNVDLDYQAYQPAVIYINGQYKGLLNIRERSEEDFVYSNYGGLEDVDIIENWTEVIRGDSIAFSEFRDFYNQKGHSLAEYSSFIDWEEFLNYMLVHLYYNDQDFPSNNVIMWRPRFLDGKWRFIAKDMDHALGLSGSDADYNTIQWFYKQIEDPHFNWGNTEEATILFKHLMEDDVFKRFFVDRAAVYMGDFLNERGIRSIWDDMYNAIKTEIPYHYGLYDPSYNYEMYLERARSWLSRRTDCFYHMISEFYGLGEPLSLKINIDGESEFNMTINGIPVKNYSFDGKYYSGKDINIMGSYNEIPCTMWTIEETNKYGITTTRNVESQELTYTMPKYGSVIIKPYRDSTTNIINNNNDRIIKREGTYLITNGLDDMDVYSIQGQVLLQVKGNHDKNLYVGRSPIIVKSGAQVYKFLY